MKKRIIAILLTVAILVSAVPLGAFGAETASEQAAVDAGDVSIEGTNGFGTLLSQEITKSQSETAEEAASYEAGYSVTDLTIEGTTATVTYDTMEEALLVVALYTEDGMRMVTSATATVTTDATEATVEFTGEMPEYFLASAYLVDTYDLSPLCAAYDTPMYTREMQELLASTVEDYDADRVLILDENDTSNFAVYAESTKIISGSAADAARSAAVNVVASVDEENGVYVIEHADETVTGLKVGEVFAYPYEDNKLLIVKIAAIDVSGTTVTITGDDLQLEEAFEAVKIDAEEDHYDVDPSSADEGISYETPSAQTLQYKPQNWDASLSHVTSSSVKFDIGESDMFGQPVKVEGSLTFSATTSVTFYVTNSYQMVELKVDFSADFYLTLTGERKSDKGIKLGKMGVYPLPGIRIEMTPEFLIRFTGSMTIDVTGVGAVIGFQVQHSKAGWKGQKIWQKSEPKFEMKMEAELFIGLALTPSLKILEGCLVDTELEGQFGFIIKGTATPILLQPNEEQKHSCNDCLDGDVLLSYKITPSIKMLNSNDLKFETEWSNYEFKFLNFYWSITHSEFGFGTCPYLSYRATISVYDDAGNPMENAEVVLSNGEKLSTNSNGTAVTYLPNGSYFATVSFGDSTAIRQIVVADNSQKVTIQESVNSGANGVLGEIVSEEITDCGEIIDSGTCGDNVHWTLDGNGVLSISGSGSMTDFGGGSSPWYEVRELIERVIIEDGITNIGHNAFQLCENMASVDIPDSITSIDSYAFAECYSLTEITIPDSVTYVGPYAFFLCWFLTDITIPDNFTFIDDYAFYGCFSLTSITIPARVVYISPTAFAGCAVSEFCVDQNNLYYSNDDKGILLDKQKTTLVRMPAAMNGDYVVPDSITAIGSYAFSDCDYLISVDIPASVTTIGDYAFYACENLTEISVDEDNPNYFSDQMGALFNKAKDTLIQVPCGISGSYAVPSSVTTIGDCSFKYCSSLTSVTIPSSVTTIGNSAFFDCDSLTDVYYSGTKAQWTWISIGTDNYDLTSATIHYNSTGPTADAGTPGQLLSVSTGEAKRNEPIASPNAVYPGDYSTEVTDTYVLKTASFTGLVPEEQYVLLAMKSLEVEDPLGADNLLFIDQGVALEDGTLSFQYVQRETVDISYVVACGASNKNLKDAEITFPEMTADGELQVVDPTVVYDGVTLTEGQDYVIVGTVDYTEEGTYTCYIRGIHNYTGLVECVYAVGGAKEYTITYTTASISLAGDIGVNYYAQLSDDVVADSGAYMQFTVAGQPQIVPVSDAVINSDGTYRFSCKVAAKQMTESITGQMYLSNGTAIGEAKVYSVKAYCDAAIPVYSQYEAYADLVELMEAMLNYGGYSQTQFGYNTDNLANAGLDLALPELTADDVAAYAHGATGSESGISVASVSLLLESTTTIRFYFKLDGTKSIDEYTFYVDGVETTPVAADNGQYYVDKVNVAAKDLDEMVTVNVGGLTVKYCGLSYVRQVAVLYPNYYSEALVNVAKALYNYNQAANAYFA